MLLTLAGVLIAAVTSLGQCPTDCRCSDYVRKTFCKGSCDASLPPGLDPDTLDFSARGYNLTVLRRADLRRMPNLTDLTLDDNHVFAVEVDAFSDLSQLVTLYLQDNLFDSLHRDLLSANTRLTLLYLSQSANLRLPSEGTFLNSVSLKSLFLENCRKLNARFDVNASAEVRVLDMRYFSGLHNLKELSLRNSGIDLLEVTTPVESCGLVILNLKNNFIETVPSEFFRPFVALEILYLDNNKLEVLPAGVFEPLKALKKLFLCENNLEQLDKGLFRSLARLELLDLSENNLSQLDEELFHGLAGLRSLDLRGNVLESLDNRLMSPLRNLEELDVSGNKLKYVDAAWFSGLDNLDEVRLSGLLALPCDCTLRRFWGEMSVERVRVVASCGSTPELSNDSFSGLDCAASTSAAAGFFGSSSAVWISVASSLVLLMAVLGAAAAYVFCRRSRRMPVEDSYRGVPTSDIYALPIPARKPLPPPRPHRVLPDED